MVLFNSLLMYTAYLDETGQQTRDWVFVAGFLRQKEQWGCLADRWAKALGPQRRSLHMTELRWKNPSTQRLLARLGPIPADCGLKAVVGGVKYSHYEDLVRGTDIEKQAAGYLACLTPLVISILQVLPSDERVELIFEQQDRFEQWTSHFLADVVKGSVEHPDLWECRTSDGQSKLAKWSFVPKDSTILLQPSDYYAYALSQYFRDKKSQRAKWRMPILGTGENDMPHIGRVMTKNEIRRHVADVKEQINKG